MRLKTSLFFLLFFLLFDLRAQDESAPKQIDVSIGNQRKNTRAILKTDLEKRITTLEKAVNQLQKRIASLESNIPSTRFVTCTLATPFNGQFQNRDEDIPKAKDKVQEACLKSTNNNLAICNRRNISCSE